MGAGAFYSGDPEPCKLQVQAHAMNPADGTELDDPSDGLGELHLVVLDGGSAAYSRDGQIQFSLWTESVLHAIGEEATGQVVIR